MCETFDDFVNWAKWSESQTLKRVFGDILHEVMEVMETKPQERMEVMKVSPLRWWRWLEPSHNKHKLCILSQALKLETVDLWFEFSILSLQEPCNKAT